MNKIVPYKKRAVTFIKEIGYEGWRMKVYGISSKAEVLSKELVSEGIEAVLFHLPKPALSEQRYGVGFLIIHQGVIRNWFLLDWWEKEDIIHHRLFSSSLNEPSSITSEKDSSLIACVHELRVIAFESEAWIKTVLCSEPNFDAYMKEKFTSKG
ncbi:MAG: hypothetical protein HRT41_13775 [Campylobacteraceae bacterium]|nr:hypothetical protein [Campylobacteraceae bacterium]